MTTRSNPEFHYTGRAESARFLIRASQLSAKTIVQWENAFHPVTVTGMFVMHYVSLYTKMDIQLEDVAICAMKSGFKTYYVSASRLGVEYTVDEGNETRVNAWQIWKPDLIKLNQTDPSMLAGKEPELIHTLNPSSVFTIAYRTHSLPRLIVLMKGLLNSFGGWMVSHDTFDYLTEAEIDAFMKV
jgi:hypothetical protein